MLIEIKPQTPNSKLRYHYNAPNDIKLGDLVELPRSLGHSWVGIVTATDARAARKLTASGWSGPIKAIIGRAPLKVEVTANTHNELRRKLQDVLDDLEDHDPFIDALGDDQPY